MRGMKCSHMLQHERTLKTGWLVKEASHMCYMILFLEAVQNRQIHRDSRLVVARG